MPNSYSITLRKAKDSDLSRLYHLTYSETEWHKFDAPYWPIKKGSKSEYKQKPFQKFKDGKTALLIEWEGEIVGTVTAYWEDEGTRWLEVGITIFEVKTGAKALVAPLTEWITRLFAAHEVERIGLTTWSGNPRMTACAEAIGMKVEGRLRKVRYYDGVYYDSVKMGVLREEWDALP